MASTQEIKTKIASVKKTQKITGAMEMVAASKMRKTQDKMFASRPYAEKIKNVITHISNSNIDYQHSFLIDRELKKIGILIVSTDRGLCGGLNTNLFKKILSKFEDLNHKNIKIQLGFIGSKAVSFFNKFGFDVVTQTTGLNDQPTVSDLLGSIYSMVDDYKQGKIDALYIAYNRFENTMTQKPIFEKLLPASKLAEEINTENKASIGVDYIYEPNAESLLDKLLTRYVESLVYQAVIENLASEQSARMVAMKSATDNAASLIDDLQLVYNKVRQTSITNELNEIVAGAAAI